MLLRKKDVRDKDPISFWYCEIPFILRYFDVIWYTAGIYGRNEDVYCINGTWISTGYNSTWDRPKNIEKRKKLNEKVKDFDFCEPYAKRKKRVEKAVFKLLEGSR